jgi:hypothetical protein
MRGLAPAVVLAAALALPAASAAQELEGYDGSVPFDCVLQQAGTGADFPDPGADPFCVEYEKRHQNVTQLGVVQFLSLEPARVAQASPKCFYFQRDHWRGSVVQENELTETYNWDGSYYFDKARGVGGVYVENFTFANQSGDPTLLPGFPEEYKPYFSQGRGGIQTRGSVPVDPACVARAQEDDPRTGGPGGGGRPEDQRCRVPGGRVERGIGGIRLRQRRGSVKSALGPHSTESRTFLGWCLTGGGRLLAGFRRQSDVARTEFVFTDSPAFDWRNIRVGSSSRRARRRLRGERTVLRRGGTRALMVAERRRRLIVGVRAGRVSFVAVAGRVSDRRVRRYLRQLL